MEFSQRIEQLISEIKNLNDFQTKSKLFKTTLKEIEKDIKLLLDDLHDISINELNEVSKKKLDLSIEISQIEYVYKTLIKSEKNKCVGVSACNLVNEGLEDIEDELEDIQDLFQDLEDDVEDSFENIEELGESEEDYINFEKEKKLEEVIKTENGVKLKGIALIDSKILSYHKRFEPNLAIPKNLDNVNYYVILLEINGYNYCLPISNKEYLTKDNKKEGVTFSNIYDENNHHVVTFKYNNMFPTPKFKMIDVSLEENTRYKKILELVLNDFENISKKIQKIYKIGKREIEVNQNLYNLINNFTLLESMTVVYKETSKAFKFTNDVLGRLFKKNK